MVTAIKNSNLSKVFHREANYISMTKKKWALVEIHAFQNKKN